MNRNLIRISKNSNEGVPLHLRIKREVEIITQRVVARRRLALSLKQPVKYGKVEIRELFAHQKKAVFPGNEKCLTQRVDFHTDGKFDGNEGKIEFKVLNKLSSSFYQGNRSRPQKKIESQGEQNQLRLSQSIQLKQIEQTKDGLLDVGRQLKMVASLKEAKNAAIKQQRKRMTSYMNIFVTNRTNKFRAEDGNKELPPLTDKLRKMKSKIEGWEETGVTEDEDFMQ